MVSAKKTLKNTIFDNPPILPTLPFFMGKIWPPPAHASFWENLENSLHLLGSRGSNYEDVHPGHPQISKMEPFVIFSRYLMVWRSPFQISPLPLSLSWSPETVLMLRWMRGTFEFKHTNKQKGKCRLQGKSQEISKIKLVRL